MPLDHAIDAPRLADLCRRFHVAKLELFGSRAQGTAHPESDVDLLVTFAADAKPSLLAADGFVALGIALEDIFGHRVDLLTRDTVERDRNEHFRRNVLGCTEVLYAA